MFNHLDNHNIWQALKTKFTGTDIKVAAGSASIQAAIKINSRGGGSRTLTLEELTKRFFELKGIVDRLPDEMDKKDRELKNDLMKEIKAIETKNVKEEQKKANFNTDNAGPEFVAVLWLLIAAFTFLATHIIR